MLEFENLLTRADIPTLENLIGAPAVRLLKILDRELIRTEALRNILTTMTPPAELLLDRTTRAELIDMLSEDEAMELASYCQVSSEKNPWSALKKLGLSLTEMFRRGFFSN